MPEWNELFAEEEFRWKIPQSEVIRFIVLLENEFKERPLKIWDLCCGTGRHTVAAAERGHEVYGSDAAPRGIEYTQKWLCEKGLQAHLEIADMVGCPWPETRFHGVFSWDAIHHNTLVNIQKTVDTVYAHLLPSGMFMGAILSDKAGGHDNGIEIEPGTRVADQGIEKGVPHHYFDEAGIRALFDNWEIVILAERIVHYSEKCPEFWKITPFGFTKWYIIARKPLSK
jgi:SAM-dependent methyltransferase